MEKYKCPKCGMEYNKPGNCTMDGTGLIKVEDKSPSTFLSQNSFSYVSNHDHTQHHEIMVNDFKKRFFICLILSIPVILLNPFIQNVFRFSLSFFGSEYLGLLLSSMVFFYGGRPFFKGFFSEISEKQPGMMVLISLAITVAFVYSAAVIFGVKGNEFFWELVTLIDIMLLGHWIEMRSILGASKALESMIKLLPAEAHLVGKNGKVKEVSISDLVVGNIILIKPGEKVAADGVVIDGKSNVDESMLTGESKPIGKNKGDKIIGGSVNGEGVIYVKVSHAGKDSYLYQVINLVKEAQESKSKTQDLANVSAKWLTIIAISVGFITLFSWLYLGKPFAFAMEMMVTVMVITCPHALGLAIPLVVSVSTSISAKNGLLIRDRVAFERARNIDTIIFDKTGTLTKGEFGVTNIISFSKYKEKDILQIAASLELNSTHPIAKSIMKKSEKDGLKLSKVNKFLSISGQGIKGTINGKEYFIVGQNFLKVGKIGFEDSLVNKFFEEGKTISFVLFGKKVIGIIALADLIRDESKEAVEKLHLLGIKCMMLTGDNKKVAKYVSDELKLDGFFAEVLPHEKSQIIEGLKSKGLNVAMVGDGVNDAPALVNADVGIAIGAGTDIAVESADIILVRNDPRDVIAVVGLAKSTYSKMKQNLFWATGYNVFAIPLAAGVLFNYDIVLTPAIGAVLMSLSTIIVSINARLLRIKK